MKVREKVAEAAEFLKVQQPYAPRVAVVLGSGLGNFTQRLKVDKLVRADDVPHYPVPAVEGHAGELIWARVGETPALLLRGRVHMYEGYSAREVVFPILVAGALGARQLVVTNAAGAVNLEFEPGDLMVIRDHVNLTFRNPLVGPENDQFGPRFPDMTEAYSRRLIELAHQCGEEQGLRLREGVLFALLGPTYETPAEVEMVRRLGGDAVTMSTVPEVIAARQWGMEVLGISVITNKASGGTGEPLAHEDVVEVAAKIEQRFGDLMECILRRLPEP
ncbi:MAG: purine-nucleoside phosphorylase [Calditrichaeota bacterium]|nr:purine-nucleoside phosphorylase [Calditrichota bacterium]